MIPTGGIPARNAHIAPQCRDWLGVVYGHLRAEELAPAKVLAVVFIRHHDVRVLMAEKLPVTLAGRIDIIRHVQGSHADLDKRMRQWRRSAIAVVFPVREQQHGRFRDVEAITGPDLLVQRLAVLIHAYHMGDVPGKVLVEEHHLDIIRSVLVICLRLPPGNYGKQEKKQYCNPDTHAGK